MNKIMKIGKVVIKLEKRFIEASRYGNLKTIKKCIKQGVDVNVKNNNCFSALTYSSYNGYLDITKLLVKNGANINVLDNDGSTALIDGSYNEDLETEQKHILFKHFLNNEELLKQVNPLKMKGFVKEMNEYKKTIQQKS